MAIPREIRPFDTAAMSRILGVSVEQIRKELRKASNFSRRRASVIFKQLPKEVKLRFEEHGFPGFFTVYRTVRSYPTKMAGNLLGYVGEVNDRILERNPYYRSGDYIGMSGIEQAYEEVLRGENTVSPKAPMRTAFTTRCPRRASRSPARSTADCRRSPRS